MILDTSTIIELLVGSEDDPVVERILNKASGQPILLSVVQIGELADWALREEVDVDTAVNAAVRGASICELTQTIGQVAARLKHERRAAGHGNFSLIDGMILATARVKEERVLTLDTGFRGLPDAIVIEREPEEDS